MQETSKTERKHQVFLSNDVSSVGFDSPPNADIYHSRFGEGRRLAGYDLAIFDFSEASFEHTEGAMNQFSVQAAEALEKGTTICFVHYSHSTAGDFSNGYDHGYASSIEVMEARNAQAGFRWLLGRRIRMGRKQIQIEQGKIHRSEFAEYLKKWGASNHYFEVFGGGQFDDIIYSVGEAALGFAINRGRGTIVYLPFHRNRLNKPDQKAATETLIDALLTYRSRRHRELPKWAMEPFFNEEAALAKEISALQTSMRELELKQAEFTQAKSLLLMSEGDLEIAVPQFITKHLKIDTFRDETYNEDFWLKGSTGNKTAICEVKSVVKGFKKTAIYDVYNHREKQNHDETFPALLFVTSHLQAPNWKMKDVSIPLPEVKIAFEHNVLIIRIEDLVRMWDGLRLGAFTLKQLSDTMHHSKGWCEVNPDLNMSIHTGETEKTNNAQ